MKMHTCMDAAATMHDQIIHLIENRTHRTIRNLRVLVDAGELVVTGQAPTYYCKQLATQAALEAVNHNFTPDGVAVDNQIEVF